MIKFFSCFFAVFFGSILLPLTSMSEETGVLLYVGSSSIGKYIDAASHVYHRNTIVTKTMMESGGGEKWVAHDHADVGGVARSVKQKYLDMGVVPTLIGKDGMGVLVHADNPVRNLTSAQLRRIFSGDIKNWQAVGGGDYPIHLYLVSNGSATFSVFKKVILQGQPYGKHRVVSPDITLIPHIQGDRGGIGVLSLALLMNVQQVHTVAVDGQEPTLKNTAYPITRPLYLTTHGKPQGKAKVFIDWTLSKRGQQLLQQYFIGVAKKPSSVQLHVNPLIQSITRSNDNAAP